MQNDFGFLFESILDDIGATDSTAASSKLVNSTDEYYNSIWLSNDTQIISLFMLDTRDNTVEQNKDIIREKCRDMYESTFDMLDSVLSSSPIIKNNYEISIAQLESYPFVGGKTIYSLIMKEWTREEWLEQCTDFWTSYDIYATPHMAMRIRCNLNYPKLNVFTREWAKFYCKTVNECKVVRRSTIFVTDEITEENKMILRDQTRLAENLLDGYKTLYNINLENDELNTDEKVRLHNRRSDRKARDIQPYVRYLIWLEKITKNNPEENLQFQMEGFYHRSSQFKSDNAYQFILKITSKDGTYRLDELKQFIYERFLKGIEYYGFHPFTSSNIIEIYIFDGGAFMTDDMKKNPMELGTVEISGQTKTLYLGFLNDDYYIYPRGRTKKYHKLENSNMMWIEWMNCRSGRSSF